MNNHVLDPNTPIHTSSLVPVHGHSLRVSAQFSFSCWADGSATSVSSLSTALLERKQLLGAEGLVVDLRCCFDQILEMGAGKEISEVDKFAVVLVFNVDHAPSVLAATDLLSSNND